MEMFCAKKVRILWAVHEVQSANLNVHFHLQDVEDSLGTAGNVMPDKSKSKRKRIDGISALVNALRGWIASDESEANITAWEEELAGRE